MKRKTKAERMKELETLLAGYASLSEQAHAVPPPTFNAAFTDKRDEDPPQNPVDSQDRNVHN